MLALDGVFYMLLTFLIEKLEDEGAIQKFGSKEKSIPYQHKILDEDVAREAETCKTLNPKT